MRILSAVPRLIAALAALLVVLPPTASRAQDRSAVQRSAVQRSAVQRSAVQRSAVQRSAVQRSAREILRELVAINTDHDSGSTTVAAQAMARRLIAAGFPAADVQLIGPDDHKANWSLVARYRGTGAARPILLLAHLDVVTARAADWSVPPYALTENDGFLYGRGTSDQKNGCALLMAALIEMKRAGIVPDRDLILALTAGEESGADYGGLEWLVQEHRPLIDAEWALNVDGGDPQLQHGMRIARVVQASEKVYASFTFEVENVGGHSSQPTKDNAIYRLGDALARLAAYDFPVHLNEITRGWFTQIARTESAPTAADILAILATPPDPAAAARLALSPLYNAEMRTTCVATRLEAGHAENALPQRATATVNCRFLPDETAAEVERTLVRVVADTAVQVSPLGVVVPSPPSPLTPAVLEPLRRVTERLYPGLPIVPVMETGATDGLYLRNAGIPTYGMSALFLDVDDVRMHGRDERILSAEFDRAAEYQLEMIKAFVTPVRPVP